MARESVRLCPSSLSFKVHLRSLLFFVLFSSVANTRGSPEETHKIASNFYESSELNEIFAGKLLKNGDVLSIEDVQSEPSFSLCKTDPGKNYTIVLVTPADTCCPNHLLARHHLLPSTKGPTFP